MAFSREQLRSYWAANKESLNAKRREKRRLAKLVAIIKPTIEEVSLNLVNLTSRKAEQVSHLLVASSQVIKESERKVSHLSPEEVKVKEEKVSLNINNQGSYEQVSHETSAELEQVSHEKVSQTISNQANQANLGAISENKEVSHNNAVNPAQVSHRKVWAKKVSRQSDLIANLKTANPTLNTLINQWLTLTNYACATTCDYAYCNNCWYFEEEKLVDYKHVSS